MSDINSVVNDINDHFLKPRLATRRILLKQSTNRRDHGSATNAIKPEMRMMKLEDYIINIKRFIIKHKKKHMCVSGFSSDKTRYGRLA